MSNSVLRKRFAPEKQTLVADPGVSFGGIRAHAAYFLEPVAY